MKKTLKIIGIVLAVLLLIIITLPFIFKGKIQDAVDEAIKGSVNGEIFYETNSFSVSLIRNFPNLSVSVGDFGVIGAGNFESDTLVAVKELLVAVDVMSAIGGEKIIIEKFLLDQAFINGIVLEDSTANYLDIILPTEEEAEVEEDVEEGGEFSITINSWEIRDSRVRFSDATAPMFAEIKKLNHEGSGDFTQSILDLATQTKLEGLTFEMDKTKYLNDATFEADLTANLDLDNGKYTFKENVLKLNDFSFGFDGWLTMNEDESMDMDITYETKETDFKNILSLVPGIFMEGFEDIKTKGSLAFNGDVKGKMDSVSMPGFKFNLLIADARFQYPDLPSSVDNIAMDLSVVSEQNKLEEMNVNLKQFHLDMGSNPVDIKTEMKFKGSFEKVYLNSDVNAKINLAEVSTFYPIEGLELKGLFSMAAKAMGTFDMENETFPSSNTTMTLTDGFVKSSEFPAPIEDIGLDVSIQNENGSLEQTNISLNKFDMLLDGDPWSMKAKVSNLDNINFDVDLNGKIDFDKITKIYPLDGMTLKGVLDAKLSTKGAMKDIDDENYGNIPTSGLMVFKNFEYYDEELLPNGFTMSDAMLAFTPSKIVIEKMYGTLGNSDLQVYGSLSNHMNYLFGENETLKGEMDFLSTTFDIDEWMVEEEGTAAEGTAPEGEEPLEVIELPKDIDFIMHSEIKDVKYDNMGMKNLKGDIQLKDGKACLNECYFELIGGTFITSGCYDPSDMQHPKFDFDLNIKDAQIQQAYKTFSTIREFAPIAQAMDGAFSTNFKINGELDQELFPIMNTVSGKGLIDIAQAKMDGNKSKILQKIGKVTKISGVESSALSSMLLDAEIRNGRLHLLPFDTKFGPDNLVNVSGSNGVDGTIDYIMKMNVPSGELGKAASGAISNALGAPVTSDRAKFDLLIGGLMDDPSVKMGKPNAADMGKELIGNILGNKKNEGKTTVTNAVNDKVDDQKAVLKAKADGIMATAQKQADGVKSNAKKAAAKVKSEGYANATKLENSSKNPIVKKANKITAAKMRKETDKKSAKIISEGNKKADGVMAAARNKVAALK